MKQWNLNHSNFSQTNFCVVTMRTCLLSHTFTTLKSEAMLSIIHSVDQLVSCDSINSHKCTSRGVFLSVIAPPMYRINDTAGHQKSISILIDFKQQLSISRAVQDPLVKAAIGCSFYAQGCPSHRLSIMRGKNFLIGTMFRNFAREKMRADRNEGEA